MEKILRLLALSAMVLAGPVHARGSVPVINHEAVAAVRASGQPASADQVLRALQAAGAPRGWEITPAGQGRALAVLSVRGKHSVSADISYASGQYSIQYRDSTNMNFEPGRNLIHPKYNMWVQTLIDETRAQLAKN